MFLRLISLCSVLLVAPAGAFAQSPDKSSKQPVFIDPDNAGPDFAVQGDYETAAERRKFGAQVVALGDGQFQIVVYPEGLPSETSDGKKRIELAAHRDSAEIHATPTEQYSASITTKGELRLVKQGVTTSMRKVHRISPTEGAKPPAGATVLFDGTNADAWQNGKLDDRRLLIDGARTSKKYQDFTMHVEFLLPFKPLARGQERGNSGVYIQDRYEVQILDTFGHAPEFDGCASMYRQHAPSINMCYPPLQWQTYDIDFAAPRFDASGKKIKNATITLRHNGVIVHDHQEIPNKTGAGKREGPEPAPIYLQDHHNPVFFRNVWIVEK